MNYENSYAPPNNCIPSSANIIINRNKRNSKLIIDCTLFIKLNTKFLNDLQYLVTLNIRKRRNALNTDIPYDVLGFIIETITSKILPPITMQSNLLKDD